MTYGGRGALNALTERYVALVPLRGGVALDR